jgi:hypothetical protein
MGPNQNIIPQPLSLKGRAKQMSYIVVQDGTKSSTDVFLINKVIGTVP